MTCLAGALELAVLGASATSGLGVRWEGGPRSSVQPLSSSDSEMTFLTSFSYELIVVCKHKLCLGSLLSFCLIRSSSFAQCFLEEESEAQVTNRSSN